MYCYFSGKKTQSTASHGSLDLKQEIQIQIQIQQQARRISPITATARA
jgi:hypothetical protein